MPRRPTRSSKRTRARLPGSVKVVPIADWMGEIPDADRTHELVVVDTGAPGFASRLADLLARLPADVTREVALIDTRTDGVAQLSKVLAGYGDLDAIHLVTDGANGVVRLGDGWLDSVELATRADEVRAWREALAPGGSLRIYGCEVAADLSGRALVEALARFAGIEVGASLDTVDDAFRLVS